MKKLILSIVATLAFVFQADAQSATTFGDATEGQSFNLAFDHVLLYPTRIYKDGVQLKDFSIAEISTLGTTNGLITFKITVAGQSKGTFSFTATSITTTSTGTASESAPSNPCVITVRPNAPGQLRKI